jgi:hypothetical protein
MLRGGMGVVIAILEQFVGVAALRRFPAQAAGCQDFMMFRFQAAASEMIRGLIDHLHKYVISEANGLVIIYFCSK